MAAKGRNIQIKINIGTGLQVIGGMQTKSFVINRDTVDITVFPTEVVTELWRKLLANMNSNVAISGTCVFKDDTAINIIEDLAHNGNLEAFEIEFENGDTFTGNLQVTSLEHSAEYSNVRMANLTMEGSGDIVLTRLADDYRGLVISLTPVAYWRFGESSGLVAVDEMGNVNGAYDAGIVLGNTGAIAGDPNTSAGFSGGVRMVAQNPIIDISGDLSVLFPVKIQAFNSLSQQIINKRTDNFTSTLNFQLQIKGDLASNPRTFMCSTNGDTPQLVSAVYLSTDIWWYLALIFSGTNMYLYVNGILDNSVSGVTRFADTGPLVFGDLYPGAGFPFDGLGDELIIYDKALTPAQVLENYNKAVGGPIGPFIPDWENLSNCSADVDGTLTKTAGGSAWNGGATSKQVFYNDGYIEFTANQAGTTRNLGLSKNNQTNHPNTTNYGMQAAGNGTLYAEGFEYFNTIGTWTPGDVLRIERISGVVYFKKNGIALDTHTAVYTGPVRADASLYSSGSKIEFPIMEQL